MPVVAANAVGSRLVKLTRCATIAASISAAGMLWSTSSFATVLNQPVVIVPGNISSSFNIPQDLSDEFVSDDHWQNIMRRLKASPVMSDEDTSTDPTYW